MARKECKEPANGREVQGHFFLRLLAFFFYLATRVGPTWLERVLEADAPVPVFSTIVLVKTLDPVARCWRFSRKKGP